MKLKASHQQIALRTETIFLLMLGIAILSSFSLVYLLGHFTSQSSAALNLFTQGAQLLVYPKATERNTFLIVAVILPILILFATRYQSGFDKMVYSKYASIALPLLVAAFLFLPIYKSDFLKMIIFGKVFFMLHPTALLFICLSLATLWCFSIGNFQPLDLAPKTTASVTWVIFILAMLLQLLSWRIASINSVSYDPAWTNHADAAFYALSQVVAGKTLLVDLPSQYGLFPELIAPLFKWVGATVLNLSLFFATLQIISLLGLFFVLFKLVKNPLLLILGGISLLTLTFGTTIYFTGSHDQYFQYWPIRFFWPAFSVLVFYYFARKKTLLRAATVSLVSAIGAFWIMDTGLFIFLSFAAYLSARCIILCTSDKSNRLFHLKKYLIAISLHLLITAAVISVLLGGMWLKSHQPLQLHRQFEYQKLFYGLGFAMLPLPNQIHPWMSVLGIYLLGIIISLTAWFQNKKDSIRVDLILYLSLLGVGLFIYYEGRAHVTNLITVCWPALMVMLIATDCTIKRIREKTLAFTQMVIPIAAVSFLLLCNANFIAHVPNMFREMQYVFKTRHDVYFPYIVGELAFIKQHAESKQECLILAKRQSIYYAESGLASPINGPGIVETLLKSDEEHFKRELFKGQLDCVFLGLGESSPFLAIDAEKLTQVYKVSSVNAEHTMLYLTPKT
ncbi:hypothetical protein Ldro_2850 [Legionella drozanskii LLAP-1]|uniref:Glycosyltransferase RgtA/B/C/D-like domain-containing protein n=1 Tax=Legionella drozanskii LLAP-1 TaxID=1212489 RepID=A0A0W0SN00_9GAMM|nr:hypothetical protein Ldro_2850 [Legionella drozanskii LLAP-1]